MKHEKREHVRKVKKVMVIYTTLKGEKVTEQATTDNISEGGLQLLLVYKLEPNELVDVNIEFINDPIAIFATCKVTHVRHEKNKYQTGLQFTKIEDFQKQRFLSHLSEQEDRSN